MLESVEPMVATSRRAGVGAVHWRRWRDSVPRPSHLVPCVFCLAGIIGRRGYLTLDGPVTGTEVTHEGGGRCFL
eukprot:4581335-Prymnesium_polylepis.1